jgi:hypothetical protein
MNAMPGPATVRLQFRHGQIGMVLRVDRIALRAWQEISLADGFLTALMTGRASEYKLMTMKLGAE